MAENKAHATRETSLEEALWNDACLTLEMIALMVGNGIAKNPPSLRIKAHAGPVREHFMQRFEDIVSKTVFHKMPVGIDEQRLIGGLDLSATLASGKRTASKGLLAQCHDEMLVVPMANLVPSETISQITSAMDNGHVHVERDGMSARDEAAFGLVVFDESDEGDQALSESLCDRIMFHLDLSSISYRVLQHQVTTEFKDIAASAICDNAILEEICAFALSLGITSMRPVQQAIQVAILNARLNGRNKVIQDDVLTSIRLSLLQRAKTLPQPPADEMVEEEQQPPEQREETEDQNQDQSSDLAQKPLEDMSIEAIASELPDGLLEQLAATLSLNAKSMSQGRKGARQYSHKRGRPVASTRGVLRSGQSLDLIATLRAAIPWQKIRRSQVNPLSEDSRERIHVRPQDFHIRRYKENTETSTIFVVDASGSTALNRLAEAKGAIESLLAEGYARRDHVALVSFRKREAEVLLSPTRSLVRAKKSLSALPGGGGTPLAGGLQSAFLIACEELRNGRMTSIVLLTDGSANVALDGTGGRAQAMSDAMKVSELIASSDIPCLLVDVSKLASPKARELSKALCANYLPMPFVSSKNLSDAVRASR